MLNSLNVAQSGLAASQVQVENVMNNIANENTIGYKKRVVDVKEMDHNDARITGRGVQVDGVNRVTNMYVYDNLVKEQSKDVQHQELSAMLADIEAIFYETDDSGFSADLDKYFQSIEELRASPNNSIYRSNVANTGQILVDDLKTLYTNIEEKEKVVSNTLDDSVSEINSILRDIGTINQKIIDSGGATTNALMDERDSLESKLSQYVQIDVNREDDYVLSIGGVSAIRYNTNIHDIKVKEDKITQKDVYSVDLINSDGTIDELNKSTLINQSTWSENSAPIENDSLTYYFNKEISIKVEAGETVNGQTVDKDNIVQAMTYKINNDPRINSKIEAFNGQYSLDENGNKVAYEPTDEDHFLIIESKIPGKEGEFEGRFIVNDNDTLDSNGDQVSVLSLKSPIKSKTAENDVHFEIFDSELDIKAGKVKSLIDNLDTTSEDNKFTKYKSMLDDFAKALSDYTDTYIEIDDGVYVSGEENSLLHHEKAKAKPINLFEGVSVKTLSFDKSAIGNLTQEDLDYLATMQWNSSINIASTEEDDVNFRVNMQWNDDIKYKSSEDELKSKDNLEYSSREKNDTSFSRYYERLRVEVSADKENVDYLKDTQEAVSKSLQLNYDKLVKVNKDDEMINLIKFQSAYEANAKLITVIDEMLATILGMKR